MKTTVFAVLYDKRTGNPLQRVELCNAILGEGRMSADRYNRLKRQMFKATKPAGKGTYWHIETANNLHDTFGGYPASFNVLFSEVKK